jgi:hypothetical protein
MFVDCLLDFNWPSPLTYIYEEAGLSMQVLDSSLHVSYKKRTSNFRPITLDLP